MTAVGGPGGLHGFLIIDKPAGWTSHDVVARLRRLLGERRIGHAGTLDPAATGVLPVAVGRATKFLEYLDDASKTYVAEVTFGIETDSLDGDGIVTARREADGLDQATVEEVLASFRGPRQQVPPMHSAVKVGGRRLYEAARRGEVVDRPARNVVFHAVELLEWRWPEATILVDCSKGAYVRSLAAEVGAALGVGGYLSNLVRVRSGPFTLCQAWTLIELTALIDDTGDYLPSVWPEVAVHPDAALLAAPALIIDEQAGRLLATGRRWQPDGEGTDGVVDGTRARTYDVSGSFLGVVGSTAESAGWRPVKMTG